MSLIEAISLIRYRIKRALHIRDHFFASYQIRHGWAGYNTIFESKKLNDMFTNNNTRYPWVESSKFQSNYSFINNTINYKQITNNKNNTYNYFKPGYLFDKNK